MKMTKVPELARCVADGKSYPEVITNIEIIIQEWIETAKSLGKSPPEPEGKLAYA